MTGLEWADIPGRDVPWSPVIIPDTRRELERIAKEGITVERVDLTKLSESEQASLLTATAENYGYIFSLPPWGEKPKRIEEQVAEIRDDITRQDAQFLVVKNKQGEIKGFSLSYTTTPEQLVREKWETEEMQAKVLAILKKKNIQPDRPITYFAEAAIDPELRGLGISKIFYKERLAVAKELGYPVIVRTQDTTPVNILGPEFGMEQILGYVVNTEYRINGRRDIQVSKTKAYGGIDTERPDRVLYALAGYM